MLAEVRVFDFVMIYIFNFTRGKPHNSVIFRLREQSEELIHFRHNNGRLIGGSLISFHMYRHTDASMPVWRPIEGASKSKPIFLKPVSSWHLFKLSFKPSLVRGLPRKPSEKVSQSSGRTGKIHLSLPSVTKQLAKLWIPFVPFPATDWLRRPECPAGPALVREWEAKT